MIEAQENKRQEGNPEDPAEAVLLHLLRHPCDLVDACRLMRQFHASVADFQRALGKFEQCAPSPTEELAIEE